MKDSKRALALLDQIENEANAGGMNDESEHSVLDAVRELRTLVRTDTSAHDHSYTYSVLIGGSATMSLSPDALYQADDSKAWLESLADNFIDWAQSAGATGLPQFIHEVDLINTVCDDLGQNCPDAGHTEEEVYIQ